jgi:hypothetical protein
MADNYLKNLLGENECIVFVTRQHWLVLIGQILAASELGVNRFTYVGQPIRLKTAMLNAKEKLEHGQAGLGHRTEVDIAGPIGQLDNLRGQGLLTEEEFQQQKAKYWPSCKLSINRTTAGMSEERRNIFKHKILTPSRIAY